MLKENGRRPRAVSALIPVLTLGLTLALVLGVWAAPRPETVHAIRAAGPAPSLAAMAGQMVLVGFRGLSPDPDSPVFRDVAAGRVGGVILFDRDVALKSSVRNVQSPEQVARLTAALAAAAPVPLLVAVDQEGGRVARLKEAHGFAATRSAAELGQANDPARTRAEAEALGRTLARAGFNLDFAPVLDVNVNPSSPAIGAMGRSFSADPGRVAEQAGAFIEGLHAAGVLACVKHFPGHGSAAADSHLGVTDVTRTWTRAELDPYRLLAPGRVAPSRAYDLVMTGHLFHSGWDPDHPATLSRAAITGMLREGLGFDGVVVSDDLQMKAVSDRYGLEDSVRLAVQAGVDILLFGNNLAYDPDIPAKVTALLVRFVQEGTLTRERLEQSWRRIMRLKAGLAR